jgi:Competence protein CoiA-like family
MHICNNMVIGGVDVSVKLDFAYEGNKLIHIAEELNRNSSYVCPFCNEVVIFRKGPERVHHFSHKPNSNCSATLETVLHFNAKYYLEAECQGPFGYTIFFNFNLKEHIPMVKSLSQALVINDNFEASLHDILVFYRAIHGAQVEHRVGPYVADVFCKTDNGKGFVIEVCVTHEMETEKRVYLEINNIPYLELIPIKTEKNEMNFTLLSYFLPEFFQDKKEEIEGNLLTIFYNQYEDELIERARKPLNEKEILLNKKQAVIALKRELSQTNLRKSIDKRIHNETHLITAQAFNSRISRKEPLHDIQYVSNRDGKKFLMVNSKQYFVSSEQNLLYEIISKFERQHNIEILIGGWNDRKNEGVIGFDFHVPYGDGLAAYTKVVLLEILEDFQERFDKKLKTLDNSHSEEIN